MLYSSSSIHCFLSIFRGGFSLSIIQKHGPSIPKRYNSWAFKLLFKIYIQHSPIWEMKASKRQRYLSHGVRFPVVKTSCLADAVKRHLIHFSGPRHLFPQLWGRQGCCLSMTHSWVLLNACPQPESYTLFLCLVDGEVLNADFLSQFGTVLKGHTSSIAWRIDWGLSWKSSHVSTSPSIQSCFAHFLKVMPYTASQQTSCVQIPISESIFQETNPRHIKKGSWDCEVLGQYSPRLQGSLSNCHLVMELSFFDGQIPSFYALGI